MAERREPAGSPRDAWTTAVVVDDWELLRLGLRAALGQLGVWVIAEAALARDGLRAARDSGAGLLVVGVIGLAAAGPGESLLTEKEREVLARLAEGGSNRAIAEALSVSPATVKTHLAHIYEKLGASDRRDALVRAIALGILR